MQKIVFNVSIAALLLAIFSPIAFAQKAAESPPSPAPKYITSTASADGIGKTSLKNSVHLK
jgi:hypothetical protein